MSLESTDARWYVQRGSAVLGPFTTPKLIELVDGKRFAKYDKVRLAQTDDWMTIDHVRELLEEANGSGPPSEAPASAKQTASIDSRTTTTDYPARQTPPSPAVAPPPPAKPVSNAATGPSSTNSSKAAPPADSAPVCSSTEEKDAPVDSRVGASNAAAKAIDEMQRGRNRAGGHVVSKRRRTWNFGLSGLTDLFTDLLGQGATGILYALVTLLSFRIVQVVLVLTAIAVVAWIKVPPMVPVDGEAVHATFTSLTRRMDTYVQRKTTGPSWTYLQQDVERETSAVLSKLEEQANFRRPYLQELLDAAEVLPLAVREAERFVESGRDDKPRDAPGRETVAKKEDDDQRKEMLRPERERLEIHLRKARRFMERREEIRTERPVGTRENSPSSGKDLTFWALIVVDGLIVGGVLLYLMKFLRRR